MPEKKVVRIQQPYINFKKLMTNGVDAIITKESFEAVQEEKKRRSSYITDENGRHRAKQKYCSKKSRAHQNEMST